MCYRYWSLLLDTFWNLGFHLTFETTIKAKIIALNIINAVLCPDLLLHLQTLHIQLPMKVCNKVCGLLAATAPHLSISGWWRVKSQIYQYTAVAVATCIWYTTWWLLVWCLMSDVVWSDEHFIHSTQQPATSQLNKPQNGAWKGFIREYFVADQSIIDICQDWILSLCL